eukprot:2103396-Rhodomonas_salina.2
MLAVVCQFWCRVLWLVFWPEADAAGVLSPKLCSGAAWRQDGQLASAYAATATWRQSEHADLSVDLCAGIDTKPGSAAASDTPQAVAHALSHPAALDCESFSVTRGKLRERYGEG